MQNLNHLERSRIKRLQKVARVGEIVFTKHGVYEAHPCEYCSLHHKVAPSVLSQNHCPVLICKKACGKEIRNTKVNPDPLMPKRRLSEVNMGDSRSRKVAYNTVIPSLSQGSWSNKLIYSSAQNHTILNNHAQVISPLMNTCNFSPTPPTAPCPRTPAAARSRQDRVLKIAQDKSSLGIEKELLTNAHETFLHQDYHNQHNHYHSKKNPDNRNNRKYSSQINGVVHCPSCFHQISFQSESDVALERLTKRERFLQEEDALKQNLVSERERYKQAMQ